MGVSVSAGLLLLQPATRCDPRTAALAAVKQPVARLILLLARNAHCTRRAPCSAKSAFDLF
jgi:hypothetical protein